MLLWPSGTFVLMRVVPVSLPGLSGRGVPGCLDGMYGFALFASGWCWFALSVWVVGYFAKLCSLCSRLHQLWFGMPRIEYVVFSLSVVDVSVRSYPVFRFGSVHGIEQLVYWPWQGIQEVFCA